MEAPKCRLCGEKHYGLCPAFKSSRGRQIAAAADATTHPRPTVLRAQASGPSGVATRPREAQKKQRAPAGTFDRTTYQRNLMRDKRAASKLGLTVAEYRAMQKVDERSV